MGLREQPNLTVGAVGFGPDFSESEEARAEIALLREEQLILKSKLLTLQRVAGDLIRLLEIEEESDSGRAFKPNRITSCRAIDGMQINQCLKTLKELSI